MLRDASALRMDFLIRSVDSIGIFCGFYVFLV